MLPVYLLTVFSKGEQVNLSNADRNALYKIAKAIVREGQAKVTKAKRKAG